MKNVKREELTDALKILRAHNIEGLQTDDELQNFFTQVVRMNDCNVITEQDKPDPEKEKKWLYEDLTRDELDEILITVKSQKIHFLETKEERIIFMEQLIKNNRISLLKRLIQVKHDHFDLNDVTAYAYEYGSNGVKRLFRQSGYKLKSPLDLL